MLEKIYHNQCVKSYVGCTLIEARRLIGRQASQILLLGLLALTLDVQAQGTGTRGTGFFPYALAGLSYDSNLLRQSDDEILNLTDQKSDWYVTAEAGVNGKLDISRQRFLIDGRIFHNAYDHYDDLDHTGGHGRLLWRWAWEPYWSGDIGYIYDRRLRDLSNQVVAIPERELRTEHRGFVSISRALGAGLSVNAGYSLADIDYEENSLLELEREVATAGFEYATTLNNTIGIEAEFVDGSFKNDSNRDYEEFRGRVVLDWRLSGRNALDAYIGYTERDNDNPQRTDFDGITGRVGLVRKGAFDRDQLSATMWRDVSTFSDEVANYAVVYGASLEPQWGIGRASTIRLLAQYERRDYKGTKFGLDPDLELGSRDDDIYTAGVYYDWRIAALVTLSFGYTGEIRDSDRDTAEYDYNLFEFRVRVGE